MKSKSDFSKVWESLGTKRLKFLFALSLGVPLAAIKSYQAYLIKPIFDKGLSKNSDFSGLKQTIYILVALSLGNYLFRYFQRSGLRIAIESIASDFRKLIVKNLFLLPMRVYQRRGVGQISSIAVDDVNHYSRVILELSTMIKELILIIGYLCVLFYHSYELTFYTFTFVPIYYFVFKFMGSKSRLLGKDGRVLYSEISDEMMQFIDGHKAVRALNLDVFLSKRMRKKNNEYVNLEKQVGWLHENSNSLMELLGVLLLCSILMIGHSKISSFQMSSGALLSFLSTLALLIDPARNFGRSLMIFKTFAPAGDRIFELIQEEKEVQHIRNLKDLDFSKDLKLKNITFKRNDQKILENLNFSLSRNEKVVLMGASGAGKTTLLNLLLGLMTPDSGHAELDGKEITKENFSILRGLVSYVSQDVSIFRGSLKENIILDSEFDQRRFNYALEVTYLQEFIDELEEGVEALVSERGGVISGGQAQRLILARAIYHQRPILVLDEATSAVESSMQVAIHKNLCSIERSIISIVHNKECTQFYDKVLELKNSELNLM